MKCSLSLKGFGELWFLTRWTNKNDVIDSEFIELHTHLVSRFQSQCDTLSLFDSKSPEPFMTNLFSVCHTLTVANSMEPCVKCGWETEDSIVFAWKFDNRSHPVSFQTFPYQSCFTFAIGPCPNHWHSGSKREISAETSGSSGTRNAFWFPSKMLTDPTLHPFWWCPKNLACKHSFHLDSGKCV